MSKVGTEYLGCAAFAAWAGVSRQKASRALARAYDGKPWRGHRLVVERITGGRGGAAGNQYRVRLDSLPAELRAGKATNKRAAAVTARNPARTPSADSWARFRYAAIEAALSQPKKSPERAAAVKEATTIARTFPTGRRGAVGASSLWRWIAHYERDGLNGLTRAARSDRNKRKHPMGLKTFTALSGILAPSAIEYITQKTVRHIKSLWRSGVHSWPQVRRMASAKLIAECRAAGVDLPDVELRRRCQLPKHVIMRYRRFAILHTQEADAKKFSDHQIPRVRRSRDFEPMQVVAADAHHLDYLVRRADGSVCTPKIIKWLDLACNRMFVTTYVLPKGKGITRAHVAQSFADMCQHPEFGLPGILVLDNGGEFSALGFVENAMRLQQLTIRDIRGETVLAKWLAERASNIVLNRAYQPQGKGEFSLAALERIVSMVPGSIPGNRSIKKTANLGQEHRPFEGSEAELPAAVQCFVDYYHCCGQHGHLGGRSPNEIFVEFVAEGWRPVHVDPAALEAAFSDEIVRTVNHGVVSVRGEPYGADGLDLHNGRRVRVRVPIIGDKRQVAVLDDDGQVLAVASPAPRYGFLDPAGAVEQARRAKRQREALAAMRAETDMLDIRQEMARVVDSHPKPPCPQSAGTIRLAEYGPVVAAKRAANVPAKAPRRNPSAEFWLAEYKRRKAIES